MEKFVRTFLLGVLVGSAIVTYFTDPFVTLEQIEEAQGSCIKVKKVSSWTFICEKIPNQKGEDK